MSQGSTRKDPADGEDLVGWMQNRHCPCWTKRDESGQTTQCSSKCVAFSQFVGSGRNWTAQACESRDSWRMQWHRSWGNAVFATVLASALPACGGESTDVTIPPATSWLLAFEGGLGSDGQLWLLSKEGQPYVVAGEEPALRRISGSIATSGYDERSGRIGDVVFDDAHGRLVFGLQVKDGFEVRSLDFETGVVSLVTSSTAMPIVKQTRRGLILVTFDEAKGTYWLDWKGTFELAHEGNLGTDLEPSSLHRYAFDGEERFFDEGTVHLKRGGQGYLPVAFPKPVPATARAFDASSSRHLCVAGPDQSAWLIGPDGPLALNLSEPLGSCRFGSEGDLVLFSSGFSDDSTTTIFDLSGTVLGSFDNLWLQVDDAETGYASVSTDVVRIDWSSLELTSMGFDDEPVPAGVEAFVQLSQLAGALLVERHAGCDDCHLSSAWVLPLDGSSPTRVVDEHEWLFMQTTLLADGSAAITSSPSNAASPNDHLLIVDGDGETRSLGPFDDVPLPLHAPVGL